MKNKLSRLLSGLGILFIVMSISLCAYNTYDSFRAYYSSKQIMNQYATVEFSSGKVPDYVLNPDMDMPEVEVDGKKCIGTIEIPSLDINLCVTSTFTYDLMRQLPCRYYGSAYKNNMVIAAHNSWFHFGRIHSLDPGSKVVFTDALGNQFEYRVVLIETLTPDSVEDMTSSECPLTLFTCTLDAKNRVTVRCK